MHVKCLLQAIGHSNYLVNIDKCPIKFGGRTISFLAHHSHLWYAPPIHLYDPLKTPGSTVSSEILAFQFYSWKADLFG